VSNDRKGNKIPSIKGVRIEYRVFILKSNPSTTVIYVQFKVDLDVFFILHS
jgi:hypothetical protein